MLPLFDAGYINLSRQYLTIGINGLVEAAEYKGIAIVDNPDYVRFTEEILGLIERYNHKYRSKEVMFNCEMIPAENVGVKHAKWDREDGDTVAARLLQQLFLRRRGHDAQHRRQVPPARRAVHRPPHGRLGAAHESRRAPFAAAVPPPVARGGAGGMQLLHVQHPQHGLQRLRTHRQTLFEGVPLPPLDEPRLPDARDRLHEAHQPLSRGPKGGAARRYYNRPERIEGGVEERSVAAPRRDE